jgi:hypothetical protein
MNPTPPGWYPDPQDPRAERWFDGQSWTDRRTAGSTPDMAPAPTGQPWQSGQPWQGGQPWEPGPAPAGRALSHTRLLAIVGVVVVVFILVSVLASSAIPTYVNQLKIAKPPAVTTMTCQDVAANMVALSKKNDHPPLVGMTGAVLVDDKRAGLKTPAPGGKALVMSCRGTGTWGDGVSKSVLVSLSLDSTGKRWYSFYPG